MTSPVVTLAQAGLPTISASTAIDGSDGVTFHYGGDAIGGFPWSHARCVSIWKAWDAYHRSRGWVGIAYNLGACIHGFIFEGRGVGRRSAAQGTNEGNAHSHAVCYIAGVGNPLTDAAKVAMLDARQLCRRIANEELYPHSRWHSTSCPGDDVRSWIAAGAPSPQLAWAPPPQPKMSGRCAAMAVTPSGRGYIEVGEDGGVFTFGDALFFGSLPGAGVVPNQPIVAAAITPSGGGYWLAAADGGLFTFGDAPYLGGLGHVQLNAPVVDLDVTPAGDGYWMTGADGGVFTFGQAAFLGSAA